MTEERRFRIIQRASWQGIFGNSFLGILKITAGLFSGSIAVVADGMDSITDIAASLVTLVTAKIVKEPPDKEHPWGHGRAETIATRVLSFIILFSGTQLFIGTITKLLENQPQPLPGKTALWVTLMSIGGKILLALTKHKAGLKAQSPMLLADARNMGNDVLLSLTVLAGLLGSWYLHSPLVDEITGLVLGLWIIKGGLTIFMESSAEMMDSLKDPSVYKEVFQAVQEVPGVQNPHRTRIRKINTLYDIELDIEAEGTISLAEAHQLARKTERKIRERLPNIFDIMIHVEPVGNQEEEEQFGLNPRDLEGEETAPVSPGKEPAPKERLQSTRGKLSPQGESSYPERL